jgi:hypothetical protein
MGEVDNTLCPAVNNGVIVTVEGDARWTVTETSYLTSLTVADGAIIDAPAGQTVTLLVDGKAQPLVPGTYKGQIQLSVQ